MEEEQFDLMPSPTYVRGFLRAYAEFLDLDGQLVLDEYESRFETYDTAEDAARRSARRRPPRAGLAIAPAGPHAAPRDQAARAAGAPSCTCCGSPSAA